MDGPVTMDTASRLFDLADTLARLRPDWTRAERFYEQRSDLAAELRAVAHDLAKSEAPTRRNCNV